MFKKKFAKFTSFLSITAFLFTISMSATAGADDMTKYTDAKERYIITFDRGDSAKELKESLKKDSKIEKFFELEPQNALVVNITENEKTKLQKTDGILKIVKDPIATIDAKPSKPAPTPIKPSESLPWGVDTIGADNVWDANQDKIVDAGANTGSNVKVAIIDTGIDMDHPDLSSNVKGGINFVKNNYNFDDDNGHGSHVAGIVAASANGVGVIGVAPHVSLYGVKVLDRSGSGSYSNIIRGINWAIANDMDVINMSLGGTTDLLELHDAIQAANANGIVIVCAAGNSGNSDNTSIYPGTYDEVVSVASVAYDSTSNQLTRSYFSNYGSYVDICAPGSSIYSTYKSGTYATLSGTSMATPHVAGTVALIIASGISGVDNIKNKMYSTTTDLGDLGWDQFYGFGCVNSFAAAN